MAGLDPDDVENGHALFRQIAVTLGNYRAALHDMGFSEDEQMELVRIAAWGLALPKAVATDE